MLLSCRLRPTGMRNSSMRLCPVADIVSDEEDE
jgi:hypothetical protein